MAELNEQSTMSEIIASYRRNASYEEDGDAAKAARFVTAIRFLLGMPSRARKGGQGGGEQEFDLETLRQEIADAQGYVAANSGTPVLDVDFSEFDVRT